MELADKGKPSFYHDFSPREKDSWIAVNSQFLRRMSEYSGVGYILSLRDLRFFREEILLEDKMLRYATSGVSNG